jgi:hypothetical protein
MSHRGSLCRWRASTKRLREDPESERRGVGQAAWPRASIKGRLVRFRLHSRTEAIMLDAITARIRGANVASKRRRLVEQDRCGLRPPAKTGDGSKAKCAWRVRTSAPSLPNLGDGRRDAKRLAEALRVAASATRSRWHPEALRLVTAWSPAQPATIDRFV